MRSYLPFLFLGVAVANWFGFKHAARGLLKYQRISPLITIMGPKQRKHYKRYALCMTASYAIGAVGLYVVLFDPRLPFTSMVLGGAMYFLAKLSHDRRVGWLSMHEAFDGGTCGPDDLGKAVHLYYGSTGTTKLVATLSRNGRNIDLRHGSTVYTLRPPDGIPPWLLGIVLAAAVVPVNVYGIVMNYMHGRPISEILTDPTHPEIS